MPISWSADNYVKLLSAILAAHPNFKPNYHNIAIYVGDGATYDAIQGCMRRMKNKAEDLRKEIETGVRPNVTPRPTPRKRTSTGAGKGGSKKGFMDDDVDDEEEVLTPAGKKARLIEEGTHMPVIKTEGGMQKKAKGDDVTSAIIDLLDSDDENSGLNNVKVKSEVQPVVVKTETTVNPLTDYYDSEDDYRE
ncbi:hypothetical protein TWF481_008023 [Arthrobotrys musiformis]|uniref:Uncharacterized protein n=1 Tax=Arthrobotrys musiformis TaxID=47236 RepID=A0AAV9W7Y6_9PEZI